MSIKAMRMSRNLTQNCLANQIGVARTTVTMWESGAAMPRADKLAELAKILSCTVDELLSDDSEVQENDA